MSQTPDTENIPQPDSAPDPADLAKRLARIERERQRVRPEDWQTLFRQMRTLLEQLSRHPFLKGDAEAEARLARMTSAADLEEFDRRVDHLAEYVMGKLAFNAAMKGEPVDPSQLHPTSTVQSRAMGAAAREAARYGPSGDDFDAPGDGDGDRPAPARPRRTVVRL